MDTHGTPVPTQWEGRGWLDRTHEHMAVVFHSGQFYSGQFYFGQVYLGQVRLRPNFCFSDFGHSGVVLLLLCCCVVVVVVVCCVLLPKPKTPKPLNP